MFVPAGKYAEAEKLMESSKYAEAYAIYKTIPDYKDVDVILKTDVNMKAIVTEMKELIKQCEVGNTVSFGVYEQDDNTENGKENIEWIVLSKDSYRALVISKYALEYRRFMGGETWEECGLRTWLNKNFLNTAFNAAEQTQIQLVQLNAENNTYSNKKQSKHTTDKVFLLSITEANRYFSSDTARRCKPTARVKARGCYVDSNDNCWWWLRSPGGKYSSFSSVFTDGEIRDLAFNIHGDCDAVRPALWIDLIL